MRKVILILIFFVLLGMSCKDEAVFEPSNNSTNLGQQGIGIGDDPITNSKMLLYFNNNGYNKPACHDAIATSRSITIVDSDYHSLESASHQNHYADGYYKVGSYDNQIWNSSYSSCTDIESGLSGFTVYLRIKPYSLHGSLYFYAQKYDEDNGKGWRIGPINYAVGCVAVDAGDIQGDGTQWQDLVLRFYKTGVKHTSYSVYYSSGGDYIYNSTAGYPYSYSDADDKDFVINGGSYDNDHLTKIPTEHFLFFNYPISDNDISSVREKLNSDY